MRRFLAASAAAAALLTASPGVEASPPPPAGPIRLVLHYDGVILVKVLDLRIEQEIEGRNYSSRARMRSHGVLSAFKPLDVHAASQGRVGDEARPSLFRHVNRDGRTNRRVEVKWSGPAVVTSASPAYPDPGDPAPTAAQKMDAADPLTQLTRIALAPTGLAPCGRRADMFDGRQLYRLDFALARPRAPTPRERRLNLSDPVSCILTFQEVAGFDARPGRPRNQGLSRPLTAELARIGPGGPWVISAIRGSTPLGEARIEITALDFQPGRL